MGNSSRSQKPCHNFLHIFFIDFFPNNLWFLLGFPHSKKKTFPPAGVASASVGTSASFIISISLPFTFQLHFVAATMDVGTPGEKDESFISAHSSLPLSPEPQQDEGLRLEEEDTGTSNTTSNDHFDVTTPPRSKGNSSSSELSVSLVSEKYLPGNMCWACVLFH